MAIDFNRKVLIAYVTGGYPDIEFTLSAVLALQKSGVSAIEIGIPYSDPVADGPTIADASHLALQKGINIDQILDGIESIKNQLNIPLYLMSYYPPVFKYGIDKLIKRCRSAGVTGMIFPDISVDEGKETFIRFKDAGLEPILLVFPNTEEKRLREIEELSGSFIYYVNLFGTTGIRDHIPESSTEHLREVKRMVNKPVCAGFGVSNRKMFDDLSQYADGVIIGSAIMKRIIQNIDTDRQEALDAITKFIEEVLNRS